ncbi:hypothetical protein OHB41_25790 [Streptomyces sp. NBC_01571]|uniref:hypothetical protein n=1 Tax=Streptomyces sp. NBC_01571 TaxID=2975883 RepID=UPI00225382CE|nr:hypothetical protein [Streptomyces sp. NBC_01571]MCX4576523.1 hypothetical protein [Streptomyces sp. NBC_01571]
MASTSLTFTLEGRDRLSRVLDKAGDSAGNLEKKLAMVGAAIPAAAALAPLAAQAGAAAVAVAAFGAAIVPQIGALSEASKAQTKYEDAVAKSGAASEDAIAAHVEFQQQMAKLPPETRKAAVGMSMLKEQYSDWSDSLAKDTMPVFTKGVAMASAALPKLTPLVKGASVQLDRLVTLAAGGMASPGFDRLMEKFSNFATTSLRQAVDGIVHFAQTLDTGKVGGGFSQFMDYARAQGPLLADTLKNVATAAVHLLEAASGVGVGLLQIANAAASLVASLPTGFITTLMQTALAIRAVRLAGSGMQLLAGGFVTVSDAIRRMGTAAIGAGTRMGSLRSAVGTLSTGAKMNLAAVGIGLVAVAAINLAKVGKQAPPDVDKLTTSLGNLALTGKNSGEGARLFGKNLDGLYSSIRNISDPTTTDKLQQGLVKVFSLGMADSTPHTEAEDRIKAIDKSLSDMVRGGKPREAAAALKYYSDSYVKGGGNVKDFTSKLDTYKSSLSAAKFEQDWAAQSMGIFGNQARQTQLTLDAQKNSADGLRASINALNDVNRSAYDSQISFEAGLDSLTESFKKNGATLDIHTDKGRQNGQAMSAAAKAQDEMVASGLAAGDSLASMTSKSSRLRSEMMRLATDAFDGNKKKAREYVNTLLGTPDQIKTMVKLERKEAIAGLQSVQAEITKTPGAKQIKVDTLNGAAIKALEAVGLKTRALPDGKTAVYTANGSALGGIGAVARALANLNGKTATTWTFHKIRTEYSTSRSVSGGGSVHDMVGATGGLYTGKAFANRYADGGLVRGPGTGTSDDVHAPWLSAGEFVIKAKSVARYGLDFLRAINTGRLAAGSLGDGGTGSAGMQAARGLAAGMTGGGSLVESAARQMAAAVTTGIKGELQIASPSKKTKALAADVGKGLIIGLTGSQAKIKSVSADLAKDIWTAFTGSKDNRYVAMVNKQTKKLLADAAKRDKLASTIATAKKYASDLTSAARESSSLSGLGLQPEEVSKGSIKGGLAAKLAQVKKFTTYIDQLAKRGLNKSLLRQVLNMGPETGYAYASALVGADKATFNSINSLQSQLDKSTTTLGQVGADRMYDSGKNAGKGFLKGLEGQQKDIEKLMMSIAKGMQKSIKKALGIKSPSRVMAELGSYSTQGLARGLIEGVPHLDRALGVITGRVAGTQPVVGRPAGAAGGGGTTVINLNVEVRPGANAEAVWLEIQRGLLSLKRHHGANVSLGVG